MITPFSKKLSCLAAMSLAVSSATAVDIRVTDGGANDIDGATTWFAGNTYILDTKVYVEAGETLTIEPGTVIKGGPGSAEDATALIVARGGKIFAEGTADKPIVFTAQADDLGDPFDLGPMDRGRWGGLIILGNATLNSPTASGDPITDQIEGISTMESRGSFGGDTDTDSSGVIRYVSIRHGGASIGSGNEINGLTLGGVGSGTTIEFVEIYANLDDGIEFFGGTAGVKYAVVAFCGDDSFDYDQGWRGKGQFWFTIGDNAMDNGGEHDGDIDDFTKMPYASPTIYNVTYVGPGSGSGQGGDALRMRENAGGKYINSIFTGFGDKALQIDSDNTVNRVADGTLDIRGNIFFDFGAGADAASIASTAAQGFFTDMTKGNRIVDPMLTLITRTSESDEAMRLDPRPMAGGPAFTPTHVAPAGDGFFVQANYVGAFGKANWAAGWTILNQAEFLTGAGAAVPVPLEVGFTPSPGKLTLGFATGVGITYQLQSSMDVTGPWSDVGDSIAGTGNFQVFETIIGMEPSLFYRVIEK